jgi:hypothetical protein
MAARYRWWEARAVERLRGRLVRRWWVGFVLVPVLLLCGAGLVVGVPLTWFITQTATANRGAASPTVAVTTYLGALNDGNEEALLPVLDADRGDALIQQWRDYQTAMHGTTAASRLASRMPITRPVDEWHAVVEVAAYPVWSAKDGSGLSHNGAAHVWRFTTRDDHGWQIVRVTPFPWCGGYVAADACA